MFCPGFWKHTQNKDLSDTNTFHPKYWIFLVSLSEFMALGLLFSRSSRTPSASLFPFENVITITQAAALKPVPALQIRRSQLTLTWGQAAGAELLCSARASWVLARTGFCQALAPKPLCYSEEACEEEQRAADFTRFALFYIFQQLFWKGCELKGWFSQTWYNSGRVKLKWGKVAPGISVTPKVTRCFYSPFCGVSISVTLYREHLWIKTLLGSGLSPRRIFPSAQHQYKSTSFLPPSTAVVLHVLWGITRINTLRGSNPTLGVTGW